MQIKQLLINQLQIAYSQMNDNNNATINQTASRFREQIQILAIKTVFVILRILFHTPLNSVS